MVTPHGIGCKGNPPGLRPHLALHIRDGRAPRGQGLSGRRTKRPALRALEGFALSAKGLQLLTAGRSAQHAARREQELFEPDPVGPSLARGRARGMGLLKRMQALTQLAQQLGVIQHMQREGAQAWPKGGHVRQEKGEQGAGVIARAPMQVLNRAHPRQAGLRYQPAVQARC